MRALQISGFFVFQGFSRSTAAATRKTLRSSYERPTIWIPVGTPVEANPEGTLITGNWLNMLIQWLHRDYYRNTPPEMRCISGAGREFMMEPGAWRSHPGHDVTVGYHAPPSSDRVPEFMRYFAERYSRARLGKSSRIIVMAAAHHRFNYIHPFPNGNGRVSRLMSHAMAHTVSIGAHGLSSISRGLARVSRAEVNINA